MNKKLLTKIIVPVLIVIVIGAIWIIKNSTDKTDFTEQNTVELTENLENADFSLEATTEIDFTVFTEYGLPVIVDYGSDSCIPCKQMAPALKTLNEEMAGKAFIKFVDVWKYTDAANNVPIQVIPTQILFNADGTPFIPSENLAAKIQFSLYNDKTNGNHVFTTHQGGLTEEEMRAILEEMGVE